MRRITTEKNRWVSQSNKKDEGRLLQKCVPPPPPTPPNQKNALNLTRMQDMHFTESPSILHYTFSNTHRSPLELLFWDLRRAYSAHFSAMRAFWIDSMHIACAHLMLSLAARRRHSPGGIIISAPGPELLSFGVQRDRGWFQHHGQQPALYYHGSWAEIIAARKSGVSPH